MFTAVYSGNINCVLMLLSSDSYVNYQTYCGVSALHVAARLGHWSILSFLLSAGATLCCTAERRVTALYEAAKNGHDKCLSLLLEEAKKIGMLTNNVL